MTLPRLCPNFYCNWDNFITSHDSITKLVRLCVGWRWTTEEGSNNEEERGDSTRRQQVR